MYSITMCSHAQILPVKGHGSLELSFNPSIACYNELGRVINGYLLGYISLDTEVSSTCIGISACTVPLKANLTNTPE